MVIAAGSKRPMEVMTVYNIGIHNATHNAFESGRFINSDGGSGLQPADFGAVKNAASPALALQQKLNINHRSSEREVFCVNIRVV
jgi:hypothetical protein